MSSPKIETTTDAKSTDVSHLWSFVAGAALSSLAWGCWHSCVRKSANRLVATERSRRISALDDDQDEGDIESSIECSVDENDISSWSECGRRPLHLQRRGTSSKFGSGTFGDSIRSLERQSSTVIQEWTTKFKDSCTDLMIQSLIQGEQLINRAHQRTRWPWDRKRPVNREEESSTICDPYSTSLKYPSRRQHTKTKVSVQKDDSIPIPSPKKKERNQDERLHEITDVCIGSIFGLDVGGTLVKLVYFEQRDDPRQQRHNKYRNLGISAIKNPTIHMSLRDQDTPPSIKSPQHQGQHCNSNINQNAASCVHHSQSQNVFGNHDEQRIDGQFGGRNNIESPIHSVSYSHRIRKQNEQQYRQQEKETTADDNQEELHTLHEHRSVSESVFASTPVSPRPKSESTQVSSSMPASPALQHHYQSQSMPTHQYLVGDSYIPLPEPPNTLPANDAMTQDAFSPPVNPHTSLTASSAPSYTGRVVMTENGRTNPPYLPLAHCSVNKKDDNIEILSPVVGTQESDGPDNSPDIFQNCSHDSDPYSKTGGITRSSSMVDMVLRHNSDKRMALDKFYKFAKSIDQAMKTTGGDEASTGVKEQHLSFYSRELGGDFHFLRFETRRMTHAMNLIQTYNLHHNIYDIGATGGGAHKFSKVWQDQLGINLEKWDELESLVVGMQFVLADVVGEAYSFLPVKKDVARNNEKSQKTQQAAKDKSSSITTPKWVDEWWWSRKVKRDVAAESSTYPYLLVTIGTGVSIVRVDGPRQHERISGSTIGGGTYWGLCRLLTQVDNFGDALNLAMQGDPTKVDMMVGDIYGNFKSSATATTNNDNNESEDTTDKDSNENNEMNETLQKLGLKSNIVASSFGKLVAKQDPASGLTEEDLARALLMMVTNNIGQVAYLNAQLHNTSRIYFVGNFLRQNQISQKRLAFAIDYWSKGQMEALFLEHEGYFGALGAFLLSQGLAPEPSTSSFLSSRRKQGSGKLSASFIPNDCHRPVTSRRRDTVHVGPGYDTNLRKNVASDLLLDEVISNTKNGQTKSTMNARRATLLQHRQTTMGDSRSSQYLDEIFHVDGTNESTTAPISRAFRRARRRSSTF